jgi:hypothetical protein
MIRIRVQYDAYNRTFKLLDREFGSVLDDDGVYELMVPLALEALQEPDAVPICTAPLAHA